MQLPELTCDPNSRHKDWPLPTPIGDECGNRERMFAGELNGKLARRNEVDHPLPHGSGKLTKLRHCGSVKPSLGLPRSPFILLAKRLFADAQRPEIEGICIFARQVSTPREAAHYPGTKLTCEHRKHGFANTDPCKFWILVMRITPRCDSELSTNRISCLAGDLRSPYEEGPNDPQSIPGLTNQRYARDTSGARPASQRKEHLLSLIIASVRRKNNLRTKLRGYAFERGIPCVSRRGFGPSASPDRHPLYPDRLQPKAGCDGGGVPSYLCRSGLQGVVDNYCTSAERAGLTCKGRGGCSEGKRIRSARKRNKNKRSISATQ